MTMVFDMMSEARVQFLREVARHPDMLEKIVDTLDLDPDTGNYDEAELIGLVAAKFNIAMNGFYDPLAMDWMYNTLIDRMRGKRIERITH